MKFRKSILAGALVLSLGIGAQAVAEDKIPSCPASDDAVPCARSDIPRPLVKRHFQNREEAWKRHHENLHEKLKLNGDQEKAWEEYIAAMTPEKPKEPPSEDWKTLSAPQRVDKMVELSKERQAKMKEHVAAMKKFYGVLDEDQKKIFDEESMPKPRHENLHEKLKLNADQEKAWDEYIAAVRSEKPKGGRLIPVEDWKNLTAPERADKMLAISSERQKKMETHAEAMKKFYATLDDNQKKIFDEETRFIGVNGPGPQGKRGPGSKRFHRRGR